MLQFPDEAMVITQYARERYRETNILQVSNTETLKALAEKNRRSSIDTAIWGEEKSEGYGQILTMQKSGNKQNIPGSVADTTKFAADSGEEVLNIGD